MNSWILITLIIGVIAAIIGVIVFYTLLKKQKEGTAKETDYRAFFILGISFLPMGILFAVSVNIGFIGIAVLGLIYLIIGLKNRDKWNKKGGIKNK